MTGLQGENEGSAPNVDAFIYATSKLKAAGVLSAVYRHDMMHSYNLGFIGTAYTAAHEAVELLLKLYLRRGPTNVPMDKTRGHDLGKLFKRWSIVGQSEAEVAYQRDVLGDLNLNRISPLVQRASLNLGEHGELPPDFKENQEKYNEAYRRYRFQLLHENSPTVREVTQKLDTELGARNITRICSTYADEIRGFSCAPETWYPEELLSLTWEEFVNSVREKKSLGLIEAFFKREGTKEVFEGWRYLSEQKLEKQGVVFRGPPAKMILIGQSLERVVWNGLKQRTSEC